MTHHLALLASQIRQARFLRETGGAAAVEFGLISSVLAVMLAAVIDLSLMVGASRDVERTSALIVKTLSNCPPRTTANASLAHRGSDCVNETMKFYTAGTNGRLKNLLFGLPDADLKVYYFTRVGEKIETCFGSVDFASELGSDVETTIRAVTKNDDTGVAAVVTANYKPFLPSYVAQYATNSGLNHRQYTVDIQGSGPASRCSKSSS